MEPLRNKGRGVIPGLLAAVALGLLPGLWGCPDAAAVLNVLKEAEADVVQHTVTYNGNGATSGTVPVAMHYVRGDVVTVFDSGSLAWPGHAYTGWNTQADGGGITYTQGQTFVMGTSDVTLYAMWTTLPTWTVTYDANGAAGGTVPVDSTHYLENQQVTVQGNSGGLTNPPYGFAVWNTKADASGTAYAGGQQFLMGTSDVTLYATWAPAYTVTYDGNGATGGTVPADPTLYVQGQRVTVLANSGLTNPGFTFTYWNTRADGGGTNYSAGQTFTMGSSNVTLYAKWVPTYTVTYNANGATSGSVPVDAVAYVQGQRVPVRDNSGSLTKTGYAYTGWNTAADGSGVTYSGGQQFTMGSSNVILFAKWAPAIWRVAGTVGSTGYSGDGGPATSATFYNPYRVAIDAPGNLYIADMQNYRVRKVSVGGTITTVAGTGVAGYSGDEGPATSAKLNYPHSVAVDAGGNLYIADTNNNRIRMVSSVGTITTVAGTGTPGSSGDDGPATSAQLNAPCGLAVDAAGSLYIADSSNHRIRKVSAGGTITTVAGTGTAGNSGDDGPATSAQINSPVAVAVDSDGNFYIALRSTHVIRKVSVGGTITTVAGTGVAGYSGDNGPATSAQLYNPTDVAVDTAANLYIADYQNYRVRKVLAGGTITTVAGNGTPGWVGDGGPATSAALGYVCGVAIDATGHLYLSDQWFSTVREVSPP